MSAPLHRLQEALRTFAQETGYGRPIRATMATEDGEQVPIPMPKEVEKPLPAKLSRGEALVLQALRSSGKPLKISAIIEQTQRVRSTVADALALLRQRGLVDHDDRGYFVPPDED